MLLASDKVKRNLILKSVDGKLRISSVKLKMSANVISHVILDMPFQVVELKAVVRQSFTITRLVLKLVRYESLPGLRVAAILNFSMMGAHEVKCELRYEFLSPKLVVLHASHIKIAHLV